MKTVFYFGCLDRHGHYLWSDEGLQQTGPVPYMSQTFRISLDGAFCPPEGWSEGLYKPSIVPPWRIISWWDRSVDTRPGSHSTFVFLQPDAGVSESELLAMAEHEFPSVFARQRRKIQRGLLIFTTESAV